MNDAPMLALAQVDLLVFMQGGSQDTRAARAALASTVSTLDGPLHLALRGFGTNEASVELGRLGCLGLRAKSLEVQGALEQAAEAYLELGMLRRHDRCLSMLGGSAAGPSATARLLARLVIFDGVSAAELEPLAVETVRFSVPQGSAVWRRLDRATALAVLESGRVELTLDRPEGRLVTGVVGRLDLFSERALLEGERQATDALATEPCVVLRLPAASLVRFAQSRPAVFERLLTLARQRMRQETAFTGEPGPTDIPVRILGWAQRLSAAEGTRPPSFEILPVYLEPSGLRLVQPRGVRPWRIDAVSGRDPGELVTDSLTEIGVESDIVHSTSWRSVDGGLVLTYLAVLPRRPAAPNVFDDETVQRAELVRGSTHGAPERIDLSHVVEHALRHLSWLSRDDPVIKGALGPEWHTLLESYQPEPFRAL